MDFDMMCETLARKIFQCGRFDDPLESRFFTVSLKSFSRFKNRDY